MWDAPPSIDVTHGKTIYLVFRSMKYIALYYNTFINVD